MPRASNRCVPGRAKPSTTGSSATACPYSSMVSVSTRSAMRSFARLVLTSARSNVTKPCASPRARSARTKIGTSRASVPVPASIAPSYRASTTSMWPDFGSKTSCMARKACRPALNSTAPSA